MGMYSQTTPDKHAFEEVSIKSYHCVELGVWRGRGASMIVFLCFFIQFCHSMTTTTELESAVFSSSNTYSHSYATDEDALNDLSLSIDVNQNGKTINVHCEINVVDDTLTQAKQCCLQYALSDCDSVRFAMEKIYYRRTGMLLLFLLLLLLLLLLLR